MTFSSGPPIITDGPAKVAAAGGGSSAVGASLGVGHWLVLIGVLIALVGVTLTATQWWKSKRQTDSHWN